jgi:hypothetical protein
MNIRIDIDCSPEEARTFLGLPDVKPLHDAMIEQMGHQMKSALPSMDPETLMKTWMPMSLQGLEQMNRTVWDAMTSAATSAAGAGVGGTGTTPGSGGESKKDGSSKRPQRKSG